MSQVDGDSDMALCGESSEKIQWLLSTVLPGRTLYPQLSCDARYFSSSVYAMGALQGAVLMLEPGGSESE